MSRTKRKGLKGVGCCFNIPIGLKQRMRNLDAVNWSTVVSELLEAEVSRMETIQKCMLPEEITLQGDTSDLPEKTPAEG